MLQSLTINSRIIEWLFKLNLLKLVRIPEVLKYIAPIPYVGPSLALVESYLYTYKAVSDEATCK